MMEELAVKNLRELKEILDTLDIKYWLDWGTLLGAVRNGKIIKWDADIDFGIMDNDWEKIVSTLPELEKRGFEFFLGKLKIHENVFEKYINIRRYGCDIGVEVYQVKGENAVAMSGNPTNVISWILKILCYLSSSTEMDWKSRWDSITKVLKNCLSLFPPKLKKLFSDVVRMMWRRSSVRFTLIVVPKHYFEKLNTIKFYGMTFNIPSDVEDYLKLHYGEDWRTPKKEWVWYKEDGTVRALTVP